MIANVVLLLISFLLFNFNLHVASPSLTTASDLVLFVEYLATIIIAIYIIRVQLKRFSDKTKIRALMYFLIAFCFGLYWLAYNWSPYLHIGSGHWGFDAQRYYYYAISSTRNEDFVYLLNYRGVVDFYKIVMTILGFDPLIPFFINILLLLYAVILIAKHISKYVLKTPKFAKYFLMLIMIPELAYYNIMSSREILCATSVIICIIYVDRFVIERNRKDIWKAIGFFLFLTVIRPPFALAVGLGLAVWATLNSKLSRYRTALMILFIGVLLVGLYISSSLGSLTNEDDILNRASNTMSGNVSETNIEAAYSENSISRMLIPHNAFEAVVFGFIRSFAYIVPEPRAIYAPWTVLYKVFYFQVMGSGMPNLTAFIMLFFIRPIYREIKNMMRHGTTEKIIIYVFLVFFFVIGVFMAQFIHIRYRVVYDLLFFTLGIIGIVRHKYHIKYLTNN